jgi:hypothetical protein
VIASATFFLAGALAWAHYAVLGRVVFGPITVWRAWFIAVLVACLVDILRHRDRELQAVWAVLALSCLASYMTWDASARPLLDNALRMAAVGGALLLISTRPAVACAACLHAVVVLTAFAAYQLAIIPTHLERPRVFLAWSFPDISAGLQHASVLAVALSAGVGSAGLDIFARRRDRDRRGGLALPQGASPS